MAIRIGRYTFQGPYQGVSLLEDRSGVYVILTRNGTGYDLVDVGESAQLKTRVGTHDRKGCWRQHTVGALAVAVLYTQTLQATGRRAIEQELRQQYDCPCGER